MGGFFGVVEGKDCVNDLFFGTDYHSHLGTRRGGMAVWGNQGITRYIHDISNAQFRSKFEDDVRQLSGKKGIGVISDFEDQPLIIGSHLGNYAIVTVGRINNLEQLASKALKSWKTHFSEMSRNEINPTELVATLINQQGSFTEGLASAMELIQGSCSILIMTQDGIYAARDRLGRTPLITGRKKNGFSVTMETCAFPNLDYEIERYLGPGEIVLLSEDGIETKKPPSDKMQICAFLWVYFGYPASCYEGINSEIVRNRCGACLARRDNLEIDAVAGIPDSGTGHAIGYANEAEVPLQRPFVKYTPTWPRSFMPTDQSIRDQVARMKLIPIEDLIRGKRILFCEDSIVRGTQLKDTIKRLRSVGAREIHMRAACPPLIYGCKFLNFSRSRSEFDLAARRAMHKISGNSELDPKKFAETETENYQKMLDSICKELHLDSLRFQILGDLVASIGLPKEKICTYCWEGKED
ncbi:MAG: amidophosphoribosyltransferase [Victivallales bacterium]|nr:amidophosphoribosyltransferase [Victivallales bacterium]